jgi:hypothetical protein
MKTIFFSFMAFFMCIGISFSQCSVSSTILTENFDTPTGASACTGSGDGLLTSSLPSGQTKGDYAAACGGRITITNNVEHCESAGADAWKTSTGTGNGGGVGNYALMVDGCDNETYNDASVWCYSTSVSAGEKYNFSAMISSPWLEEKQNDPDVYFTVQINGGSKTQLGSTLLMEQYTSSGATPYEQQCGTYTIPSGGTTATFCINLKQREGGTATSPGSGTYGADGQGNDILVDDIKIDKVSGSGCGTSGSDCAVTTPVTLLNFNAVRNSSEVAINWQTAMEISNDYFTVEKSKNGIDFTAIGIVDGAGNSQSQLSYHASDPAPYAGTSYYRLKQTDYDGKFSYSKIVAVKNEGDAAVEIYPNPNQGSFRISVSAENKLYNIEITDLEGRLVYKGSGNPDNQVTEVSGLSKGIYVVRVLTGSTVALRKLVVI